MSTRIETGACFCGAVAAEMEGEPFWICYDHDDDCRRAIGSPLTVWVGYRPRVYRLLRGEPKSFSKTKGVVRTFCSDCGTSISYSDDGLPDELYRSVSWIAPNGSHLRPTPIGICGCLGLISPTICPRPTDTHAIAIRLSGILRNDREAILETRLEQPTPSVVIPALRDQEAVFRHFVNKTVFLRQPPRPPAG